MSKKDVNGYLPEAHTVLNYTFFLYSLILLRLILFHLYKLFFGKARIYCHFLLLNFSFSTLSLLSHSYTQPFLTLSPILPCRKLLTYIYDILKGNTTCAFVSLSIVFFCVCVSYCFILFYICKPKYYF